MQNQQSQYYPSQRPGGTRPPPLSKYYYGPAQPWIVPDRSPTPDRSPGWLDSNVADLRPSLPPRVSPASPAHSHAQSRTQSSISSNSPSSWQPPLSWKPSGPHPSAPQEDQVAPAPSYNPSIYGLMPSARQSPVDPFWSQRKSSGSTSDSPKWENSSGGANYTQAYPQISGQMLKPPLPPRAHNLAGENQDYNQHGPLNNSQHSTPWVSQESRASQAEETLPPIAYSSVSPPVLTNPYQISSSTNETYLQPASEPQHFPPPKPPKVPQTYEDELQRNIEAAPQHGIYAAHTHTAHFEPPVNHNQHQYQDFSEKSQRRSDPTSDQTVEPIAVHERRQDSPSYNESQQQRHSTHSSMNNEVGPSHAVTMVEGILMSPVVGDDRHREHEDNDDIRWIRPPVQEDSNISTEKTNNTATSRPNQHLGSDASQSFPNRDTSQPHFSLSVGTTNTQPPPQNIENPTMQQGFHESEDSKNEHQQGSSFYWHKESRPSSRQSNISIDNEEHKKLGVINTHQHGEKPEKSVAVTQSPSKPYNASALGFGGPSDWEHFGDYEAEEVDDTDLYDNNNSRAATKTPVNSAELPAETSPIETRQQEDGSRSKLPESSPSLNSESPPPLNFTRSSFQERTVHPQPSVGGTFKQTPSSPEIEPLPLQRNRTHANTNSSVIPQPLQSLEANDVDATIRLWSENPALPNTQEMLYSSPKSGPSAKLDSSRSPNHFIFSNDLASAPKLSNINDSTQEQRPLEHKPVDEIRLSSRCDSDVSGPDEFQSTQNSNDEVDAAGIKQPDLLPGTDHSIQPQQSPEITTEINTTNGSDEAGGFSRSKLDIYNAPTSDSSIKGKSNLYDFNQAAEFAHATSLKSNPAIEPSSLEIPPDLRENINRADDQLRSNNLNHEFNTIKENPEVNPEIRLDETKDPPDSKNGFFPTETRGDPPPVNNAIKVETSMNASKIELYKVTSPGIDEYVDESVQKLAKPGVANAAPLVTTETDYPYAGLDAWGRASLNRYAIMLKEEAQAETDKDKLDIFMVFARRETKLRAVLYGADDEMNAVGSGSDRKHPKHLAKILTKRSQKALPALPPVGEPSETPIHYRAPGESSAPREDSVVLDIKADQDQGASTSAAESPTDEMQYSPGGRPIVTRAQCDDGKPKRSNAELTLREKVSKVFTQVAGYTNVTSSPGSNAPISGVFEAASPQKPAYVPFKYESHTGPTEYKIDRQSAPYAALKLLSLNSRLDTAKNSVVEKLEFATAPPDEHIEKLDIKANEENVLSAAFASAKRQTDAPLDLRRFIQADFDPLVSVLPSAENIPSDPPQLQQLKKTMDAIPDDFSFIHQTVVAWDAVAKKEREIHERERHVRQGESERNIDALFDDHVIGYGDIPELESDFKSSEAARKADEDRVEYQTFVSSVFDAVWTRLHYEISQLQPYYDDCTRMVNDSMVGKDMFEGSGEKLILAPTMSLLLALHQKLEIRHQKAFEAVLERDRRLKKTEVSPLYALGNVAKVKQLENQFDSAEKQAIVEFCEQRRVRAHKLVDELSSNTSIGVGANQDYMEAIMKSIRRIASGRAFASMPSSEVGLGVEEVTKAKRITTILTSSSEQIVQTFHVTDMLLNAADYEFSLANAKFASADAETFARLKEERAKEDQKLTGNLENRLALIREASRQTDDEIVKLLLFLGVQNGHSRSLSKTPSPAASADPGHEDRMQKALEEAKQRNAAKAPG